MKINKILHKQANYTPFQRRYTPYNVPNCRYTDKEWNMGKSGAIANLAVILGPIVLGVVVLSLVVVPTAGLLLMASMGAGLGISLLVVSKWPKLCAGDLISFGPARGSVFRQKCYFAAHACITVSILSFIAIALSGANV